MADLIAHQLELRVYNSVGGGTPVTIPATGVRFSVGLGGEGFLSCDVDARAEPLASDDTLLDDCVIKVAVPLADSESAVEVAAYANRRRNGVVWEGSGRKVRSITGAASLWTAWAQDAILHPESNEIVRLTAQDRYFGWMSKVYDYDNDPDFTWGTPDSAGFQSDSDIGNRVGNPEGWPAELGDAEWLGPPGGGTTVRGLYIADVTLDEPTAVEIYYSGDESAVVYFGGELVIQTTATETGFTETSTWKGFMPAGTHRVGIDATHVYTRSGGNGEDCVLLGLVSLDTEDNIDEVLLVTNPTDFVAYRAADDDVPSLTPGEIALELYNQAQARGVDTWDAITATFTGPADSESTTWPEREERAWRLGYDTYLDMIEGLGDLGFDPEITPDLDFNAYVDRGTDVSATVVIEAGVNGAVVTEEGDAVSANYMPVETQQGWAIVQSSTSQAAYGRREAGLSMGNAPSVEQGRKVGAKVMAERLAIPVKQWTVEFYAVDGCVPFADFNLGDTIGVKVGDTTYDRVVLDIAGQARSVNDIIRWTVTTGDVLS